MITEEECENWQLMKMLTDTWRDHEILAVFDECSFWEIGVFGVGYFWVPKDKMTPEVGMKARLYGEPRRYSGYRGLDVDGMEIFYEPPVKFQTLPRTTYRIDCGTLEVI